MSADTEAAEKFIEEFDDIIEKGAYHPGQIYNVDETGLFWKKCWKGPTYTKRQKQYLVLRHSRTG